MSNHDEITSRLNRLRSRHRDQLDALLAQQHHEEEVLLRYLQDAFPTNPQPSAPPLSSTVPPPEVPIATRVLPQRACRPVAATVVPPTLDCNQQELLVGDRVTLLTSGKRGNIGDSATVVKLTDNRSFVVVSLAHSGQTTQRAPASLRRCPQPPWSYSLP